jgi:ubiquinone/menaquinone biosynthesis C-methylase UbiE
MNRIHRVFCNSARWGAAVETRLLPWALDGVPLGSDVLEIGPGFGATTRVLAGKAGRLTAIEVDATSAGLLRDKFQERVRILTGDAANMPIPDASYDAVVCFTMLHHVPSPAAQDRLFGEAWRVLRPGGVFAGSDSRSSFRFRLLHIGDTMVAVDPEELPSRLTAAGFDTPAVSLGAGSFRFRATRPA